MVLAGGREPFCGEFQQIETLEKFLADFTLLLRLYERRQEPERMKNPGA